MANPNYSNVNEMVDELAQKLVAKEEKQQDEDNTAYWKRVQANLEDYRKTILEKINIAYKEIQNEFPGIALPDGILVVIAENITQQIELGVIKIPKQIKVDKTMLENVVATACEKTGRTVEELRQLVEDNNIKESTSIVLDIIGHDKECKICFEEPEDFRYCLRDEEDKLAEEIIETLGIKFLHLMDNIDEHPENLAQVLQIIRETPNGLGIDAGLRYFAGELNSISHVEGNNEKLGVSQLISSEPKMEAFKALIEEMKKNKEFTDDKFTTANKLSIITSILSADRNSPVPFELKSMLQEMDPICYEMVKNNLDAFIKMQEENENPFNEEVFANESYDRKAFLKRVEKKIKVISTENKRPIHETFLNRIKELATQSSQYVQKVIMTLGLGPKALPEAEFTEAESPNLGENKPKQIKSAEKYEILKGSLQQIMKSKGTKGCVDFAIAHIKKAQDVHLKQFFAHAILDTLQTQEQERGNQESKEARKNLFMVIIENVADNSVLEQITRLDRDTVKDLLGHYGEKNGEIIERLGSCLAATNKQPKVHRRMSEPVVTSESISPER